MAEVVGEFGEKAEYRLCTSVYEWGVRQKYGVLQTPTVVINGAIQTHAIDREKLRQLIGSQLKE